MKNSERYTVMAPIASANTHLSVVSVAAATFDGFNESCLGPIVAVPCWCAQSDVLATPSNERLRQLAAAFAPPQHWFEGDEEDLF